MSKSSLTQVVVYRMTPEMYSSIAEKAVKLHLRPVDIVRISVALFLDDATVIRGNNLDEQIMTAREKIYGEN